MKAGRVPVAAALLIFSALLFQIVTAEDIYWEGEEDASNEFLEVNEDEHSGLSGMLHRVRRAVSDTFSAFVPPSRPSREVSLFDGHIDEENTFEKDDPELNFGSGALPEKEPDFREKTLRVTFVVMEPYQTQYSNRDSEQFQNFSRSLADAVNQLYETLPGTQRASLVRIQSRLSDEFSCKVTLDILTTGYDDADRIITRLREHIRQKRTLGPVTVSDADFSASVIDPAECEVRCGDGRCEPASARCDGRRDCDDGSDEEGCPIGENEWQSQTDDPYEAFPTTTPRPRGDGVAIIDENTEPDFESQNCRDPIMCIGSLQSYCPDKICDGMRDCPHGDDERDCDANTESNNVDNDIANENPDRGDSFDEDTNNNEVEVKECRSDELRCDKTRCVSLSARCDRYPDCHDGKDEENCESCGKDDFVCKNNKCIESHHRCDKIQDCADGEDEFNCPCLEDEFQCRSDGSCIENRKRCDNINHCLDNSDETDCACSLDQWQCDYGNCIKRTKRCDGRVDCPSDRSDERNCHATGYFQCRTGKYIPESLRCNRQYDCPLGDYSDEKNCPCGADDFKCDNDYCIPASQRCDRTHDCQDGSDERNCNYAQTLCMASEYKCSNGKCVSADARCNGTLECSDGSDEVDCPCKRDEYRCRDGTCINSAGLCNGFKECPYGDDEANCDKCRKNYWQCSDGNCIEDKKVCDGHVDCIDRSDEALCQNELKLLSPADCPEDSHRCDNGSCAARCNGVPECADGEDEENCINDVCYHKCDGRCLEDHQICDSVQDCSDNSDEQQCDKCDQRDEFRCDNGDCISEWQRCNNITECRDGSDERDCNIILKPEPEGCKDYEYQCNDGQCINNQFRCDRNYDCNDRSDEDNCPCNDEEWKCTNGQCISRSMYCDNTYDCTDASDEANCATPGPFIPYTTPRVYQTTTSRPIYTYPPTARPVYNPPPPVYTTSWPLYTTSSPYEPPYVPQGGPNYDGCNRNEWRCENGPCIHTRLRCNGHVDCPEDDSDELDCPEGSPAALKLKTYPEAETVRYGGDVVLQCRDEGPERTPIRWIREGGRPIKPGFSEKKGRLEINRVSVSDSGIYICQAPMYLGSPGAEVRVTLHVEPQQYTEKPPQPACGPFQATCANGQCISKTVLCDGKFDCSDKSDEDSCNMDGTCAPNEFKCGDGKCLNKVWVCDGDYDCDDQSDERDCASDPGQTCKATEFACKSNKQCIPRSFHCDHNFDCMDNSDEIGCDKPYISKPPQPNNIKLFLGDTLRLTCEAVGMPTPLINWRLNWGHVPKTCTSTSENGKGVLVCTNMLPEYNGAYSCEAMNSRGTNFAVPDAIVTVDRTDPCPPGYFNSEANSAGECIRCFCFGESTECRSADLFTYTMPMPLGQGGTKMTGVQVNYAGEVQIDSQSQAINDLYYYQSLPNGASVTKLDKPYPAKNVHPYVTLPETYNGNQLTSYGGYLRYRLQPHFDRYYHENNVPDIIIKGKYGNLVHYHRRNNNERGLNVEVRLVPGYWQKGSAQATREDIMMTLDDVDHILLRADLNGAGVNITDFSMESAQLLNVGLGAATLVEECSCPPGYEGLSCQKCASGFSRKNSGPWLGTCEAEEKPCPPGTYGSPDRGIGCKPCPCPHTNRDNQFARTCSLGYNGNVICDCMAGYQGEHCESCAPGYVGNPYIVGDSCRPRPPDNKCNPVGTSQVRLPDECECKDNVRGRHCDQCKEDSFYLSSDFRHGCAQCFCSGVTQMCSSSNLRRKTTTILFNVPQTAKQVKIYNSTLVGSAGATRYKTPVETNLQPAFYRGELALDSYDQSMPTIYYWSLPVNFAGDKVTSYGGYLRYTLRHDPTYGSQRNNAADVLLISDNGLTFHYFGNFASSSDGYVNGSVQFLEKGWLRPDGKEVQRENILLALADVKTILIKATYNNNVQASLVSASIETAEPGGDGPQALHVEQCSCPEGYQGTSCEDCAAGYTRSGTGLYLEHCGPCECNGHSQMCHPETGVCYDCKDNTAGDNCEECRPGYEKDRYGNCVQPYNPDPGCNCDARGFTYCENQRCFCKANVEGENCDRCRPGTFGLEESNPDGCLPCYCSGVTNNCHEAAHYTRIPIPAPIFGETYGGYTLQDLTASLVINDQFVPVTNESELMYIFNFAPSKELYWSLPGFSGNRILSYGGYLTLTQKFHTGGSPADTSDNTGMDVVLEGAGRTLYWTNPNTLRASEPLTYKVLFTENGWTDLGRGSEASRNDFLSILANLERILVRATLAKNIESTAIADVSLTTASDRFQGKVANGVEVCFCPVGYTGTSCESCSSGYFQDQRGNCRKCNCNGHECQSGPYGDVVCICRPPYTGRDCSSVGLVMELHPTVYDNYSDGIPLRTLTVTCKYRAPEPLTIQFFYEGKEVTPPKYHNESWLELDGWHGTHSWSALWDGRHKGLIVECHTATRAGFTLGMLTSPLPAPLPPAGEPSTATNSTTRPPVPQSTVTVNITSPSLKIQKVGETVNFTCQAYSRLVHNPLEVTWSKEHGELPRDRYHSDPRTGLLLISQVQASDSGKYVCKATDGVSIAEAVVTLSVPGNQMTEPTVSISPTFNEYNEGDRIELECVARGTPTPRIFWQRAGNRPLPLTVDSYGSFLSIERASVDDSGEYSCIARNAAGSVSRTAVVTVRPRVPQPAREYLTVLPQEVSVNEGQNTTVVCTGTARIHPGTIRWMRQDGTQLNDNVRTMEGVLYINVAKIGDQGVYVCQTSSTDVKPVNVLVSVQVDNSLSPDSKYSVSLVNETVTLPMGETRMFDCFPSGYPLPRILWSKYNGELGETTSQRDNALVISNARKEDAGHYICEGFVNDASVAFVYLEVIIERREAPTVEISPPGEQTVQLDSRFRFTCNVGGVPNPDVTWSRDGGLPMPRHVNIQPHNVLNFDRIEGKDEGKYTCTARNMAGTKSSSAVLRVISPPNVMISNPYTSVSMGNPVNVECRATGHPLPQISIYKEDDVDSESLVVPPSYEVVALRIPHAAATHEGRYSCVAESAAGKMKKYFQINILTIDTGDIREDDSTPLLLAIEGKDAIITCNNTDNYVDVEWVRTWDNPQRLQDNARQNQNTLIIYNASQNDSGRYECITTNPETNEVQSKFTDLEVVRAPRITLDPPSQTVQPGQSPRVTCVVDGTYEELKWSSVGRPFSPRVTTKGSILTFNEIEVEDAGYYECSVRNSVANATMRAEVIVAEESSPVTESHEHEQFARVGSAVLLGCNVPRGAGRGPGAGRGAGGRVLWTKDGRALPRSVRLNPDGSVFIKLAQIPDSGHYVCIIHDEDGRKIKNYINLHIEGPRYRPGPRAPLVYIEKPSQSFTVGQNVEVLCRARDRNTRLTWTKPQTKEFVPNRMSASGDGLYLDIRSVGTPDAGVYRCEAQDAYGHTEYDDFNLDIVPGTNSQQTYDSQGDDYPVYSAQLSKSVSLPCSHDLPPPVRVQWSREYVPLSRPELRTNEPTLHLQRVTEADAGTYICRVYNNNTRVENKAILKVTGVVPSFDGYSWLALPNPKDVYKKFEIEISFKPQDENGLIFYNSENQGREGDFVALQLVNSIPQFVLQTGSGAAAVDGDRPLQLNVWHTIRLNWIQTKSMIMDVDNTGTFSKRLSGYDTSILDLNQPLYIGGVPDFDQLPEQLAGASGFVGCISKLIVGSKEKNMILESTERQNINECNTCSPNLCKNNGVCQEARNEQGYTCLCRGEFAGADCGRTGDACRPGLCGPGKCQDTVDGPLCACPVQYTGERCENQQQIEYPAFTGNAFLAIKPEKMGRTFRMNLSIRPSDPVTDGIIVYYAESASGHGGFTSLAVKDGKIEFRYDVADGKGPVILRSQRPVPSNTWTQIHFARVGHYLSMKINQVEDIGKNVTTPQKTLNLDTPLYVGGYDDSIVLNNNTGVSGGFSGCIRDVSVLRNNIDIVNASIKSAGVQECSNVADRGDIPERVEVCSQCRNGGHCASPNDRMCTCLPGFAGHYCEQTVDACDSQPCYNGGSCQADPDNRALYVCDCPLGFTGQNCQNRLELLQSVGFNGNGYLELPSSLIRYELPSGEPAVIALAVLTTVDGVLLYQREARARVGYGDYILLRVDTGKVVLEWDIGGGPSTLVAEDVTVTDGEYHRVIAKMHSNRSVSLEVDGYSRTGTGAGFSDVMNADSNIYIGGIPEALNVFGYPGLTGCFDQVELMASNRGLPLGALAVAARNTQRCREALFPDVYPYFEEVDVFESPPVSFSPAPSAIPTPSLFQYLLLLLFPSLSPKLCSSHQ